MSDATTESAIQDAREAFAAHRWGEARQGFLAARATRDLSAGDMEALAEAAWWEGAIDEALSGFEEAYRRYLQGDDPEHRRAAMLALDIGFSWFLRGEEAIGSGWLSRAERLLDGIPEGVEHGYLRSLAIDAALAEGRFDEAIGLARSIAALAGQYGDETLCALVLVGEGIARIKQGDVPGGMRVLDEAMLPVVAGRVRPTYAGNIYCQLMDVCHELGELRRAEQWTDATARWCEGFSSAVMFMGICRVHRAQLMKVRGSWDQAEAEIAVVCQQLASMNVAAVGMALYELGDIRRLRGDLDGAEAAFAGAHQHGRDPLPGLALVHSAQGRHAEALDLLRRGEEAALDPLGRAPIWEASVEAALAAGELDLAKRQAASLDEAAETFASSGLLAAATLARGRLQLASGDVDGAAETLEAARRRWQDLDAPFRVAEVRALLAAVHEERGDPVAAAAERLAADELRRDLGLAPCTPVGSSERTLPDGITPREAEVLALVAQGLSNRNVAERLVLSEKTVARHLSNLYTKIGVGSRTAAAAYAHANGLTTSPST